MKKNKPKVEIWHRDPRNRPEAVLRRLQFELMPEHQLDIVFINPFNGEYVLGKTWGEAYDAYQAKWPGEGFYFSRVDGGPAGRGGI